MGLGNFYHKKSYISRQFYGLSSVNEQIRSDLIVKTQIYGDFRSLKTTTNHQHPTTSIDLKYLNKEGYKDNLNLWGIFQCHDREIERRTNHTKLGRLNSKSFVLSDFWMQFTMKFLMFRNLTVIISIPVYILFI